MADAVKQILARPIQLADRVSKAADEATYLKQECAELKTKTEKLAALLRQAARASGALYERPTRRIVQEAEQVLDKALSLVLRCRSNALVKRVFTIMPIASAAFRKMSTNLDNSIADVTWLLRVGDGDLGLPPIAVNEPYLRFIWEPIAVLHTGSVQDRSDAAASLVSLAGDNDRNCKLIVEEGGVPPLLKLLKEGKEEGQEHAARAIGLLASDGSSVEQMVRAGVCSVFSKILKQGPMKVQAVVAWAVAELVGSYPKCQELFGQNNVIRLLVSHLAFETIQEHSKYAIVAANKKPNQMQNLVSAAMAVKLSEARELEDTATKAYLKSMAARALSHLAKGNPSTCRSITESRALLCFAVLIEKGPEDVRLHSAIALMEITSVAEEDSALRRSAFKPNSPSCRAVIGQLLNVIEHGDSDSYLLVPCINSIGNLARTFRATETRMIAPLVRLLESPDALVSKASAVALAKFADGENYLHLDHCRAIVASGGVRHLVQLVYFGEQIAQLPAVVLLGFISIDVPDEDELAQAEALSVLDWASKQSRLVQNAGVDRLLQEAKSRLELYQSRGPRAGVI